MLMERCYKALGNLICKRTAESSDNKYDPVNTPTHTPHTHTHTHTHTHSLTHTRRLLAKYELFEQQQLELQNIEVKEAEEEEAVEEVLTPDEKKRAESVRRNITKYVHVLTEIKAFH